MVALFGLNTVETVILFGIIVVILLYLAAGKNPRM